MLLKNLRVYKSFEVKSVLAPLVVAYHLKKTPHFEHNKHIFQKTIIRDPLSNINVRFRILIGDSMILISGL